MAISMSFVAGLTIAAALLAVWIDCLAENRRPKSLRRRSAHVVAAFAALQGANFAFNLSVGGHAGDLRSVLLVFFLFLPSLVYTFLSGLWLMRTLAEMRSTARR